MLPSIGAKSRIDNESAMYMSQDPLHGGSQVDLINTPGEKLNIVASLESQNEIVGGSKAVKKVKKKTKKRRTSGMAEDLKDAIGQIEDELKSVTPLDGKKVIN